MVVRARVGTRGAPQGTPAVDPTVGSAGLTPQMSIVNPDRTPTTFFFRWLLNVRGGNQTPWTQDIDAAGNSLNNLGSLSLNGPITFPDGTIQTTAYTGPTGGTGTVTSVALTMPPEFAVLGSPVTSIGTLQVTKVRQTQNLVYASPASGTGPPAFRPLVPADIPGGSAGSSGAFGDTILVNEVGLSDDPTVTVNAAPFFTVNGGTWPQVAT